MEMTLHFKPENLQNNSGFTLIELLMVIILVAIVSVVAIDAIDTSINEGRFDETYQKMIRIRSAMIGNADVSESGTRTSFGFIGDIGGIPTAAQGILALVAQPAPALPVWALNSTVRFGIGWNGPYLSGGSTDTDYTKDAWGTAIAYNPTSNPSTLATLVSLGADRQAGGTGLNQDITLELPIEQRMANVSGFVCNHGGPFTGSNVDVELNYPNGAGVLLQNKVSLTAVAVGQFSFSSVPFGVRSISIYVPQKIGATITVGPVVITVDKINYLVPCEVIDVNP